VKLYIIGNGFDIEHGLDTSYWSFRKFLEEKYLDFLIVFEKLYNIEPLDESEPWCTDKDIELWNKRINHSFWSTFEEMIGKPNVQSMLDFSTSVIDSMDPEMIDCGIKDTMDSYWREEYGYIKNLQKYVKEWIEQVDLSELTPIKDSLINNIEDYFLNFNYTNVLEEIYNIKNVIHIHGSVGKLAIIDPFMGHCNKQDIKKYRQLANDANEEYNDAEASIHDAAANYLDVIYKDTSYFMKLYENDFKKLNNVEEIIVFGWSAGNVDIPYLCKIKDSVKNDARWTAFFYDDKSRKNLEYAFGQSNISNYCLEPSKKFWE